MRMPPEKTKSEIKKLKFAFPFHYVFFFIAPKMYVIFFWTGWLKRTNPDFECSSDDLPGGTRLTWLSAQKARRTKSRGLQLDVQLVNTYHQHRFFQEIPFLVVCWIRYPTLAGKSGSLSPLDSRFPLVHLWPRNSSKSEIRRYQSWKFSKYKNISYVINVKNILMFGAKKK